MNKFLTPRRMADRLEDKVELDRETCGRFTSELFEIIMRELQTDDSFSLFGFGSFKKIYVAPNKGRNPHTGETIYVPAHYRIKFSPAGKLGERINKDYAHLEPILLEKDEMIHEGLLLKAERYIMTAAAEPEPETEPEPASEPEPNLKPVDSVIEKSEEPTVISESETEEIINNTELKETEEKIAESIIPADVEDESYISETSHEEYIHREPDFGFKKDQRNRALKLALISLATLFIILGIGWLIFRNSGSEPVKKIIITEETVQDKTEEIMAQPVPEPDPETVIDKPELLEELQAPPETNYDILPGDSFSLLAQKSWGNIYLWPYLYKRNSNLFPDPDLVKPGDNIVIPPQPNKENDQIRIEDSILFAYQRYRSLISEQRGNPKNPNRELSAGYVLLGGEKLYPSFLDRKKAEIRTEDIRKAEALDL